MISEERGGIMGTLVFLAVVVFIMAIVVIDGISIYKSYSTVHNATKEAAEEAAQTYKETRNETRAALAAEDYCINEGFEFVEFNVNREMGNLFEVTCATEADTYAFKYLPWLKDMVRQESTNAARPM
ncbi:MAG: hypothetical protein C4534_06370 [Gaiellales bacterium]|nr:MAG: hypothetical protein C4534_06370 [Gaiellales bacterium]